MKLPTFAAARADLLQKLAERGWDVRLKSSTGRPLVVPYAVAPSGFRVDFKPQAVYDHHAELSLHMDIRQPGAFEYILRFERGASQRGRYQGNPKKSGARANPLVWKPEVRRDLGPPPASKGKKAKAKPSSAAPPRSDRYDMLTIKVRGDIVDIQTLQEFVKNPRNSQATIHGVLALGPGETVTGPGGWSATLSRPDFTPQFHDMSDIARIAKERGGFVLTTALRDKFEQAIRRRGRGLTRSEVTSVIRRDMDDKLDPSERSALNAEARQRNPVRDEDLDVVRSVSRTYSAPIRQYANNDTRERSVGAAASFQIGSDVYPCTIIKVSPSGHQITVQQSRVLRARHRTEGPTGVLFEPDPKGDKMVFTRNKYGSYTHKKHYVLRFGGYKSFSDAGF